MTLTGCGQRRTGWTVPCNHDDHTGWPTRYCVEPKGHDGPHYAGDRHTWGVTWNAVDPDDYTGVADE